MPNGVRFNETFPSITASSRLLARAERLIPAQTQTLAKGPTQFVRGVAPVYAVRGKNGHVFDADGNEFIDLSMGVGPISLGYAYPAVDRAIARQLEQGITFSLPHTLEVEVAELLCTLVPRLENVRYAKTGAEATSAAVRLARAYTGKKKVLACGYHGWHDWYISVTDRSAGIPEPIAALTHTFRYGDLDHLERSIDDDTACVILEPITFEEPPENYLGEVKRLCRARGVLLIFDEMWTGFRLALGGAQEKFDVTADLVTYSKAVANGMPIAVLGGRADVMRLLDRDVFFFSTFGGEALSLAATLATLEELRKREVPRALAEKGRLIKDGFNTITRELGIEYARCLGPDCRTTVIFDPGAGNPLELKSFVQQELIRCGVLWNGFHNLCFTHDERDLGYLLDAYRAVLARLDSAVRRGVVKDELKGDPVAPVFRRTTNFNTKPRA